MGSCPSPAPVTLWGPSGWLVYLPPRPGQGPSQTLPCHTSCPFPLRFSPTWGLPLFCPYSFFKPRTSLPGPPDWIRSHLGAPTAPQHPTPASVLTVTSPGQGHDRDAVFWPANIWFVQSLTKGACSPVGGSPGCCGSPAEGKVMPPAAGGAGGRAGDGPVALGAQVARWVPLPRHRLLTTATAGPASACTFTGHRGSGSPREERPEGAAALPSAGLSVWSWCAADPSWMQGRSPSSASPALRPHLPPCSLLWPLPHGGGLAKGGRGLGLRSTQNWQRPGPDLLGPRGS